MSRANLPAHIPTEIFKGWYDQDQNEWVMLVRGAAHIVFEQDNRLVKMTSGSYLDIKAHQKHKVQWTDPDQPTVWLAVFY